MRARLMRWPVATIRWMWRAAGAWTAAAGKNEMLQWGYLPDEE